MSPCRTVALFPLIVMLAAGVGACAKQPLTSASAVSAPPSPPMRAAAPPSAPSAPRPVSSAVAPAAGPPSRGMVAAPRLATPPAPSEFRRMDALKDIHFDFDRYDIRPEEARILDANVSWLRLHPTTLVLIEGHCDERGTSVYNLSLGDRRARTVMTYLVFRGVRASRIVTISYGEERPICTDADEACRARNRRAHFLVKDG